MIKRLFSTTKKFPIIVTNNAWNKMKAILVLQEVKKRSAKRNAKRNAKPSAKPSAEPKEPNAKPAKPNAALKNAKELNVDNYNG